MELSQAIILAGGFGTRLQSIVKEVPKPMADISGKPFLVHLLSNLQNQGFKKIIISVGYLKEKIINFFGNSYLGMEISYAIETNPLGTGGAIVNSLNYINKNEPVFIINGDSFLNIDYKKMFKNHREDFSMVLRKMSNCSRYGVIEIDDNLYVKKFIEKSDQNISGLINAGIYLINPKIFNQFSLPEKFSFEIDFLVKNINKLKIYSFLSEDYFIDIGIPEDYQKAQIELPKIIKNKALILDRDGVINIDYGYVHKKENFKFIDGIFEICRKAKELGYLIIITTNQAGIAKGLYSEQDFLNLTYWMEQEFSKENIQISKTYYCPYHVDSKIEKYQQDSFDRKPNPGMILKAIDQFNLDKEKCLMIGDKETDMIASKKAGVDFILFQENQYDAVIKQKIFTKLLY